MDLIDKIIEKKLYKKSQHIDLSNRWCDFYKAVGTEKFILFGVGEGAKFFLYKYGSFAKVKMVVDNNEDIQGVALQSFVPDISNEELIIKSPSLLKKYRDTNVVVLIASLKYYEEIACELESYGIKKYYSVLCMEALERKKIIRYVDYEKAWLEKIRELPVNPKKVCIFPSAYGAGHIKEIIRQLLLIRKDLKIVWLVYDLSIKIDVEVNVRLATNEYIYEYEVRTSSIWIGDTGGGFPAQFEKKECQIGIELKHWSSITLKKFYFDENIFNIDEHQKRTAEDNIKRIDYIIVGSEFDERTCRSGLKFNGKFVYAGSPRSDILFRDKRKDYFLRNYPKLVGKKLLLYAPTFRRTGEDLSGLAYANDIDFDLVSSALNEQFSGEWNILLRLHPLVAKDSKRMNLPDYVIDVSAYPDAEELVAASDAVVTDYSSIMFEPAYVRIPVFLLATDLEVYTSKERDFYIEYENLPFPIAKNNDELRMNILSFDEEKYRCDVSEFFDKYGVCEDGHAAERAAKFILDLIDKKVIEGCQ